MVRRDVLENGGRLRHYIGDRYKNRLLDSLPDEFLRLVKGFAMVAESALF